MYLLCYVAVYKYDCCENLDSPLMVEIKYLGKKNDCCAPTKLLNVQSARTCMTGYILLYCDVTVNEL